MYRLEATENCRDGTKRIIIEQLDASITLLQTHEPAFDVAIHEARKNMKRVRAALRLVRGEIGEAVYARENARFRDTARVLAPLRDSAVLIETVDMLRAQYADSLSDDAIDPIHARLKRNYETLRDAFMRDEQALDGVLTTWKAARSKIEALPIEHGDFRAFEYGLRRVYGRGRRRMLAAYAQPPDSVRFHDWRKRVKYLWHHMEILNDLWPDTIGSLAGELKQISKYLGDAHDLVVLDAVLGRSPAPGSNEPERRQLLALAARRQAELEAAARPLGLRVYAESPRSFTDRISRYWHIWHLYGRDSGTAASPGG